MIRITTFPRLYRDSVTLMALAARLERIEGVDRAGVMMATPANLELLAEAGLVDADGSWSPDDLLVAVRADTESALDEAEGQARRSLGGGGADDGGAASEQPGPGSIAEAMEQGFAATVACVSVPGIYAGSVVEDALKAGLHVFCFSDNVSVADEVRLKAQAVQRDLLVMGPDCGTALIDGVGLGFINELAPGPVGMVSASGTGAQEVSCLLDHAGVGVSQIIGVGGRDLSAEVGGVMTFLALDKVAADPDVSVLVLVSKPPAPEVADAVIARLTQLARADRPVIACLLGLEDRGVVGVDPLVIRGSLQGAARAAAAASGAGADELVSTPTITPVGRPVALVGLFTGGTLAHEAKLVLRASGASAAGVVAEIHDLGDDQYTRGRPHPMIDPAPRSEWISSLADRGPGVLLLDVVLGHGSHPDPAGEVVAAVGRLRAASAPGDWTVVATVTGTERDPQRLSAQTAALTAAGIDVHLSAASATRAALAAVGGHA